MQTQTLSPITATRDNPPEAHPAAPSAELWDAIERGIAENIRIILAPPNDPAGGGPEEAGTRAARKIRALEIAARVLERAEKARTRISPADPAEPARRQIEAPPAPCSPEKSIPPERKEPSDAPLAPCPQPLHPAPAPPIILPTPPEIAEPAPSQTAPPAKNTVPKTPRARFPYTPPKTTAGNCLSELLNIEDELPADPDALLALHRKAGEYLGPAFQKLLQEIGANGPSSRYTSPRGRR